MTVHFNDIPEIAGSELAGTVPTDASGGGLYRSGAKRFFDVVMALVSLPIALPIMAVFALIVALDGRNPFYTQERVGLGGRKFRIFKLRSMVPDADERLEAYLARNPAAKAEWETTQKLKQDPRVTRIGRFIRRSSIDELPQLINVLIGDMSLVGPRPMLVEQVPLYPGAAYYRMRPGITGLWQISDRNDCAFSQRATYDATYAEKLSLGTDIRILGRTIKVVLRCTGY